MHYSLKDLGLNKTQAYIEGRWYSADQGQTFTVQNPATGECIAEVADLGTTETRRAIDAAARALPAWRALSAQARCAKLHDWYQQIVSHAEDLAILITLEQGKPIAEARKEVAQGAAFVQWFAEEGKRVYGDIIPLARTDQRGLVRKQPVGVVAAITPWNFPHGMILRKAGPALAVGCTLVLKPAPATPLSALALAELADRAGLPAGVLNVIPGSDAAAIGGELTRNPIVRKITFTGSTRVGKHLLRESADTVKRLSLELGGNAPLIVFNDADLELAVAGALAAKYRNSGQTCICANRIFVQAEIYESFVTRFVAEVSRFRLGSGLAPDTTQGPLISEQAVAETDTKVQAAIAEGATLLLGGQPATVEGCCFYQPTVLTDVTESMRVFQEEIFGPVAPIIQFDTEQEAIYRANATEYGLAAYLYTQDMSRIWRVAEQLEYGMVGVNETTIGSEMIPFGGIKASGQGREGSKYGVDDYLETQYICLGGIKF